VPTLSDISLLTALAAFAILLRTPAAIRWPFLCALLAVLSGSVSMLNGEWQAAPGLVLALLCVLFAALRSPILRYRRAVSSPLILLTAACALPFWFFPIFRLPPLDGSFAVGTISVEMTDPERTGLIGRPANESRRLPVRIWYPAPAHTTGSRAAYTGRAQAMSLGTNFGQPWFYYTQLAAIRPHAIRAAAVAPGPWPVVLFNHGFWSYPEQNTALVERLASHGYVVVAIGHPGDAVAFRLTDGTRLDPWPGDASDSTADRALEDGIAAFMGGSTEEARFAGLPRFDAGSAGHRIDASARAWRDDNLFVLAELHRTQLPQLARVTTQADFARVAVVGMSFGGSVAPSACARIPECRAAINLDGESFDFSTYNADFGHPLLVLLTGQPFSALQYPDPATNPTDYAYERWARIGQTPDVYRMRVASLRHLGLMDLLLSAREPFKSHLYGVIDADRGIALVNDAALEFLDRYLKSATNNFPAGFFHRYPEVSTHDASHVRRWWLDHNSKLGCPPERVAAIVPVNDADGLRLGAWIRDTTACGS